MKEPGFYKDQKNRMSVLETRVDERELALIYQYLTSISMFVETRSELGRMGLELAASVVRKQRPDFIRFDTATEAGEFLRERGVGLKRGTRRGDMFDKLVKDMEI